MKKMVKQWLKRVNGDEQGEVLILALIVIVLVSFLIGPLLSHMSTGLKNTRQVFSVRTDEQYAADAGVAQAMWYIKYQSDSVPEDFSIADINGKNVIVNIESVPAEDESITYTVVSRAGSTTTTAVIGYTPETEVLEEIPPTPDVYYFGNALATGIGGNITLSGAAMICSDSGNNGNVFSGGQLVMGGSSSVEGDCYARSNIDLDWSTTIDGDADASGTVDSMGTVTGERTAGVPLQDPPAIAQSVLDEMVQGVYDGTTNVSAMTPGGDSYPSGLTVKNQSGTHYPRINVTGDLVFQNTNNPVVFDSEVYVTGNIHFKSGTQNLTFTGPVHAGGQIYVGSGSGTILFQSKVVANSINFSASAYNFTFNGKVVVAGNFTISVSTAVNNTLYVGGNLTSNGSGSLNSSYDIYVKGSLTMNNSTQLSGLKKVVVRGNITMGGATALSAAQLPFVIVPPASTTPALSPLVDPTTVNLANSAIASAVIYAPTCNFTASGAAKLVGGIVCKSAVLSNSAQVEYLVGIGGRDDLVSPGTPGTPGIPGSPEYWGLNSWVIQ